MDRSVPLVLFVLKSHRHMSATHEFTLARVVSKHACLYSRPVRASRWTA
jgi:hypothetical protein